MEGTPAMIPVDVPASALADNTDYITARVGPVDVTIADQPDCPLTMVAPPPGVDADAIGLASMLTTVDPVDTIPDAPTQRHLVYFRPTPEELEQLAAGAVLEVAQHGPVVQPFTVTVRS